MTQSQDSTLIPTGFHDLDFFLRGGVRRSDFIVLASVTTMGKTSFALSMAHTIVQRSDFGVAYITLQMTSKEIAQWMTSIESGIPLDSSRVQHLTTVDREKLNAVRSTFVGKKLWIIDETRLTTERLQRLLEDIPEQQKPDLIVIDDVRMMQVQQRTVENSGQETARVAGELKMLAKTLNIAILALASVPSTIMERESPLPTLEDLQEIGPIETYSDVVLFLHREEAFNDETDQKGRAEVIVAKNSHGGLGSVTIGVDIASHRFSNLGE